MAFALWPLLLPLGSAAYRVVTLGSGASNATEGGGRLEAGMCGECDTYDMGTCVLCPNCKWRDGKCMHSCTACCAYKHGCTAEYCACDGKTNAFKGMWKACGSQRKEKSYHFQVRVPQEAADRSKDVHIAMQLSLSREDPKLILRFNQEWTVRFRREQEECRERKGASGVVACPWGTHLAWEAQPAGPGGDPSTKVIPLAHMKRIRVFKAQLGGGKAGVTALEITAPDSSDTPLTIYGGLYVPRFALTYALERLWPRARYWAPRDDGSGLYVSKPAVEYKPGRGRHDPARKPVRLAHVRVSKLLEFLDRSLNASGGTLSNKHRHAMAASIGPGVIAGEVGAFTGALAGAALAGAAAPLVLPAVLLGAVGGAALPMFGVAWGTHKVTMADTEREVGLLASEKIFEKMRCHRLFQRCSGAVIAPASGRCPGDGGRAALVTEATSGWESSELE